MKAKVIFLLVALLTLSTGMEAQNWKKNKNRKPVQVERRYSYNTRRASTPRYVKTVTVLPYGYSQIRYNNGVYFYSQGNYYRPLPNRHYEIILPQVGMMVPELPYYEMVRYNGRSYYAYNNHLYSRVRTPYGFNFRVDIRL